ncbi:hypothetical protein TSUD_201930 [Trifolium subterraneum]|uniref:U1-type domain-containing protein n=1 Tax=Trifolium subterraneum TaxID=3900 RepID=A0A2Z6MQ19_TRISU|nr:hypothetical protein TSUD_201930 [Trifolium subterraneum]
MEFKFRAVDNVKPSTTLPSLPAVTYLPDNQSLPLDGGFSGYRVPMAAGEAALRREIEKEQIRREILAGEARRRELEDEVRRELAMERELGILPMHRFSLWSNSAPMNPAVDERIGVTQPQIKATCESGLNAHLKGKKHRVNELRQKRKIDRNNKKREKTVKKATETVVTPTKLGVDAETDQPCIALEVMNETMVDKAVAESKKEEQFVEMVVDKCEAEKEVLLVEMVADNGVVEAGQEELVETVADNGVSVTEPKMEKKLVETESKAEEKFVEKSQNTGWLERKKDAAATEEAGKIVAWTKSKTVQPFWCDICQIGTPSAIVMEGHMKGKKHVKKMKYYGKKNTSPSSISSVSQKAPRLIEDADGVNKETDQVMIPVVKGELIIKMEENFLN